MQKTTERVTDAAGSVRPYVERAIKDEELRDNVKTAFTAAREIYDELLGDRGVTRVATKVATDQDIQENLRTAVERAPQRGRPAPGQGGDSSGRGVLLIAGIVLGAPLQPVDGPRHAAVAQGPGGRRRRATQHGSTAATAPASRLTRDQIQPRTDAAAARTRPPSPSAETGATNARRSEPGSSPLAPEMSDIRAGTRRASARARASAPGAPSPRRR